MKIDSNADTIVLGSDANIMHYTNRECNISHYAVKDEPIWNVPIFTRAIATSSNSGMSYILILNKAIWMGELLEHSLVTNPNQLHLIP
jgi:hypothetical protein